MGFSSDCTVRSVGVWMRAQVNGSARVKRWFVIGSATGTWWSFDTSSTTATAVPADYDGDLRADYATWESSSGLWQVYSSWTGALLTSTSWGVFGDAPVPADYDGGGKADLAVSRKWELVEQLCDALGRRQGHPVLAWRMNARPSYAHA